MSDILVRVIDAYIFYQTNDGIKYLIMKRAKTKMYEHLWQGVAGKIEVGDRINFVPVFGIEVDREDVKISEEHCDFKWVDFEIAKDTLVWKGQKEGITAVNNMLNLKDNRIKWSEVDLNTMDIEITK
jgi:hypothetical protein